MKKNSIMVKQVLMSIITAGIFTFGFTSCSDDDPMSQDSAAANQEITSDGEGISKPIGLVYTDFITENDVQILNADTTEIAVSKALADKKGITNFVNHPMGIWQAFDQGQGIYAAIIVENRNPMAQAIIDDFELTAKMLTEDK